MTRPTRRCWRGPHSRGRSRYQRTSWSTEAENSPPILHRPSDHPGPHAVGGSGPQPCRGYADRKDDEYEDILQPEPEPRLRRDVEREGSDERDWGDQYHQHGGEDLERTGGARHT